MAKKSKSVLQQKRTLTYVQLVIFAIVFAAIGGIIVNTFAAPASKGGKPSGGGSGSGTISLVMVNDKNSDGQPNWGDTVTFSVSTTATTQPWVNLYCYVNGTLVAQGSSGFFTGALGNQQFGLYSSQWTSGPADCTAYLDKYTSKGFQHITSLAFHVNA